MSWVEEENSGDGMAFLQPSGLDVICGVATEITR